MPSAIQTLLEKAGVIEKQSVVPRLWAGPEEAKPVVPEWNLKLLYDVVEKSWPLQQIFRAVIQEVKRPGWTVKPKFIKKCTVCGKVHQFETDECVVCGSKKLRKPNEKQRQRGVELIHGLNSQRRTFGDILGSITYHDLVADDWYLSVEYAPVHRKNDMFYVPRDLRVEDPRTIRPVVDKYGNFGNSNEWFCPVCWSPDNDDVKSGPGLCECGLPLKETAYVQEINNQIKMRWSVDQMVHGSTHGVLPNVYGTPRAKSLWHIIHVLQDMDEWFVDTFGQGRPQKVINFPNMDQTRLTELWNKILEATKSLRVYDKRTKTYRSKKSLRTVMIASPEKGQVLDIGINPKDIQLLDFYKLAIQACCGVYGVQAIFISAIEKGKAGTTPAMQIKVQKWTTREYQRDKEEVFTNQLFPIFGIHDWEFKFKPLEQRDRDAEAQIYQRTADAALTFRKAGFDVWFDEYGEMHWSKEPAGPIEGARTEGETPKKTKRSRASGMEIEGTTTERFPHGPRSATPRDEV